MSYDRLTGLPGRRALERILNEELDKCAQEPVPFTVGVIDIDNLKLINEALGCPAGDEVVRGVGEGLGREIGQSGFVAKLGSGEFGFLHKCGRHRRTPLLRYLIHKCEVLTFVRKRRQDREIRLLQSLIDKCEAAAPNGIGRRVTLCYGIALYPADGRRADDLLETADARLAIQKQAKRYEN